MTNEERQRHINDVFHTRGRPSVKELFDKGIFDMEEFHKAFLEERDLTEYKAAMRLVGDWERWQQMKRSWSVFNANVELWKSELNTAFKSEAIQKVLGLVDEGNLQAAKWVAEEGWERRQGAGRPTKKQQDREARELAQLAAESKEEQERVLRVVKDA